jgi:conjugal transfer pilus assembly protein TraW
MTGPSVAVKLNSWSRALLALALACAGSSCLAQAGEAAPPLVVGPIYEISEPSMLDELMKKLKADEASGVLRKKIEEGQRRALHSIKNPKANEALARAKAGRTWYYDPTVTATQDITANGKVIVAAGTSVNPLDKVNWSKLWLFIDARDPTQLGHARQLSAQLRANLKVILTGGNYVEAGKSLGTHVYFDQHALLTNRFGITALPATVRQEGRRLRIDEVKL